MVSRYVFTSWLLRDVFTDLSGFLEAKHSLPKVMFFDNNCQLLKVIKNTDDTYFDNTWTLVDAFHFEVKHKISDEFCAQHYNPALFPFLMDGNRWRFNSSAAERTNSHFTLYRPIVREMRRERYTFFLDEMVRRINKRTVEHLETQDANPQHLSRGGPLGLDPRHANQLKEAINISTSFNVVDSSME